MEIWKPIQDYPNYEISNLGNVRSIRFGKIKNLSIYNSKHKSHTRIGINGKGITLKIHTLVANAFIPNPENLPEIDHIDRNPNNNNVLNLRWVTRQQNMLNTEAHYKDMYAIRKHGNGFIVKFKRNQNMIYLPICRTIEEAKKVRDEWLIKNIY